MDGKEIEMSENPTKSAGGKRRLTSSSSSQVKVTPFHFLSGFLREGSLPVRSMGILYEISGISRGRYTQQRVQNCLILVQIFVSTKPSLFFRRLDMSSIGISLIVS